MHEFTTVLFSSSVFWSVLGGTALLAGGWEFFSRWGKDRRENRSLSQAVVSEEAAVRAAQREAAAWRDRRDSEQFYSYMLQEKARREREGLPRR